MSSAVIEAPPCRSLTSLARNTIAELDSLAHSLVPLISTVLLYSIAHLPLCHFATSSAMPLFLRRERSLESDVSDTPGGASGRSRTATDSTVTPGATHHRAPSSLGSYDDADELSSNASTSSLHRRRRLDTAPRTATESSSSDCHLSDLDDDMSFGAVSDDDGLEQHRLVLPDPLDASMQFVDLGAASPSNGGGSTGGDLSPANELARSPVRAPPPLPRADSDDEAPTMASSWLDGEFSIIGKPGNETTATSPEEPSKLSQKPFESQSASLCALQGACRLTVDDAVPFSVQYGDETLRGAFPSDAKQATSKLLIVDNALEGEILPAHARRLVLLDDKRDIDESVTLGDSTLGLSSVATITSVETIRPQRVYTREAFTALDMDTRIRIASQLFDEPIAAPAPDHAEAASSTAPSPSPETRTHYRRPEEKKLALASLVVALVCLVLARSGFYAFTPSTTAALAVVDLESKSLALVPTTAEKALAITPSKHSQAPTQLSEITHSLSLVGEASSRSVALWVSADRLARAAMHDAKAELQTALAHRPTPLPLLKPRPANEPARFHEANKLAASRLAALGPSSRPRTPAQLTHVQQTALGDSDELFRAYNALATDVRALADALALTMRRALLDVAQAYYDAKPVVQLAYDEYLRPVVDEIVEVAHETWAVARDAAIVAGEAIVLAYDTYAAPVVDEVVANARVVYHTAEDAAHDALKTPQATLKAIRESRLGQEATASAQYAYVQAEAAAQSALKNAQAAYDAAQAHARANRAAAHDAAEKALEAAHHAAEDARRMAEGAAHEMHERAEAFWAAAWHDPGRSRSVKYARRRHEDACVSDPARVANMGILARAARGQRALVRDVMHGDCRPTFVGDAVRSAQRLVDKAHTKGYSSLMHDAAHGFRNVRRRDFTNLRQRLHLRF